MCDLSNNERLFGRKRQIEDSEIFEIVNLPETPFPAIPNRPVQYGDNIGFRSINNKNFVGVNIIGDEKEVTSRMPRPDTWETFILVFPREVPKHQKKVYWGSAFALKADNKKFLRFNKDGDGGLYADADRVQDWEIFHFINPSEAK